LKNEILATRSGSLTGFYPPCEVRLDVGAALAAFADELQLDIRQPNMVRPAIGGRRAKDNGEAIWKPERNDNQSIIGALRRMPGCP
jgi:hypothetical protein